MKQHSLDSAAVSIFVVILVELTNTDKYSIFNSTNITTNIVTAVLSSTVLSIILAVSLRY